MGISSLFHNIILLTYVEAKSTIKRSLILLKMRASYHDNSILEFVISNDGLKIIDTINEYEGILPDTSQGGYTESRIMEDEITKQQQEDRKKE